MPFPRCNYLFRTSAFGGTKNEKKELKTQNPAQKMGAKTSPFSGQIRVFLKTKAGESICWSCFSDRKMGKEFGENVRARAHFRLPGFADCLIISTFARRSSRGTTVPAFNMPRLTAHRFAQRHIHLRRPAPVRGISPSTARGAPELCD